MNALPGVREVFDAKLADHAAFRTTLDDVLRLLQQQGARGAIAAWQ
jgi:fructuronate reductase